METKMRLITFGVTILALLAIGAVVPVGTAFAVSGAVFTTVNEAVDGEKNCNNGNPPINCNIYDGKEYVWLNGGPASNGLSPDGQYFFAVLVPGGQPDPNDGGAKNLSDDFDAYTNRTFTVTDGEVSAYGGTHDFDLSLIRLFPYADTTNPGGVYIMAVCSIGEDGSAYPVDPRDCKYDAFKVKRGRGKVQFFLSGKKYKEKCSNGQYDPEYDPLLQGWDIRILCDDGTDEIVTTDASGDWSFASDWQFPSEGTTTCEVSEIVKDGWVQTGNTVDQSIASGIDVNLIDLVYMLKIPNDAPATADGLHFGNKEECR